MDTHVEAAHGVCAGPSHPTTSVLKVFFPTLSQESFKARFGPLSRDTGPHLPQFYHLSHDKVG